jgi:hypothetical protein
VVVTVGAGIVNNIPDPIEVPPQLTVYQFKVPPDPPIAVNVILPPALEQKLFLSTVAEVGATGAVLTVTTTLAQVDGVQLVVSHLAK